MKNKFFKVYMGIYMLVVFISSAAYIDGLIYKLNLPDGVLSAIVHYGGLLLHLCSFCFMLYRSEDFIGRGRERK